jgi:membrane dipeptidase
VITLDLHVDTPTASLFREDFDLDARNPVGHVDFPRMAEGGLDGVFFAAWVEERYRDQPGRAFARVTEILDRTVDVLEGSEGGAQVRSVAELRSTIQSGRKAVFLAVEGGHAIEGSLERLGELAHRGIRYMTLTWNHPNEWADACCSPPVHGGLTTHGRRIVAEMGRLGIFPDLSHAADSTFWDSLDASVLPPLVTHACARSLVGHARNISDDMARELAARGGVVGLAFVPGFIDADVAREWQRLDAVIPGGSSNREEWTRAQRALPPPSLERLVDHFHHFADLAGPEYLALGSDFDGVPSLPAELNDVASLPLLREALQRRGFSEGELDGIFGGNFLRLLESVDGGIGDASGPGPGERPGTTRPQENE